jgi:hypothetical protein
MEFVSLPRFSRIEEKNAITNSYSGVQPESLHKDVVEEHCPECHHDVGEGHVEDDAAVDEPF